MINYQKLNFRKICNNCRCKFEDHQVVISRASAPKKFVKKKIIEDEGGKPNYPNNIVPLIEQPPLANQLSQSNNDLDLPPPPQDFIEVDNLGNQVQGLSMNTVTVSIPVDTGTMVQENGVGALTNGAPSAQPVADTVRNSFVFVPDGANDNTVRITLFNYFGMMVQH